MAVVADSNLRLEPDIERARELAREANLIPVAYRFVDDTETPVSAFLKLRGSGPAFLLESAEQGRLGRYSFLGFQPRAVLRWSDGVLSEWTGAELATAGEAGEWGDPTASRAAEDPYGAVAEYLDRFKIAQVEGLPPFAGGAVGYFGYDLVRTVEPLGEPNPDPLGLPDMVLMISDVLVVFDHQRHELTVLANAFVDASEDVDAAYARAADAIEDVRERLARPVPRPARDPADAEANAEQSAGFDSSEQSAGFVSNMTREQFEANVSSIIEYVHAGDAFQVVPSQRFSAACPVEAFSIYRGLRTINPSPYMYFLDFGDFEIAGASPEPLV